MPNQREIARKLGLTQATVSMALRNHPLVAVKTRRLVKKVANEMGYQASPYITTLMAHVRAGLPPKSLGCIAILVDAASEEQWLAQGHDTYPAQYAGYRDYAARHAYRTECFYLQAPGMSDRFLERLLQARGITGLILAAPRHAQHVNLVWEHYACATVSYTWTSPRIDRVSSHHRHNMDRAFAELVKLGCQRIGFCLPKPPFPSVSTNWISGYLVAQSQIPKTRRLPVFVGSIHDTPLSLFQTWYRRWRPDGLVTLLGEEAHWLGAMGVSPFAGTPLVCLNRPSRSPFPGVDENNQLVGEAVCEIVVNKLAHNNLGIPEHPKEILIEGVWKAAVPSRLKEWEQTTAVSKIPV